MDFKKLKVSLDRVNTLEAILQVDITPHTASVQLLFDNFDSGIFSAEKVYHAMQHLHKFLDSKQIKLLCNCYCLNIRPSGMSISMGGGVKAYLHLMGQHSTELVNIFDPVDDISLIATYDEQRDFVRQWQRSL